MYVVSYCIIAAFHPDLNLPRVCIYKSFNQPPEKLMSLSHFYALDKIFFKNKENYNQVTLKQYMFQM